MDQVLEIDSFNITEGILNGYIGKSPVYEFHLSEIITISCKGCEFKYEDNLVLRNGNILTGEVIGNDAKSLYILKTNGNINIVNKSRLNTSYAIDSVVNIAKVETQTNQPLKTATRNVRNGGVQLTNSGTILLLGSIISTASAFAVRTDPTIFYVGAGVGLVLQFVGYIQLINAGQQFQKFESK